MTIKLTENTEIQIALLQLLNKKAICWALIFKVYNQKPVKENPQLLQIKEMPVQLENNAKIKQFIFEFSQQQFLQSYTKIILLQLRPLNPRTPDRSLVFLAAMG